MKKATPVKKSVSVLAAEAQAAELIAQRDATSAKAAKTRYKTARKAYKQARKTAKKSAKLARRLREQVEAQRATAKPAKRSRKPVAARSRPGASKSATPRAAKPKAPVPSDVLIAQSRDAVVSLPTDGAEKPADTAALVTTTSPISQTSDDQQPAPPSPTAS
jgi:hypothetical protein